MTQASSRLRVLHVVPSFAPAYRYGGPIVSVLELCKALLTQGVDVRVATTDADGPRALDVPSRQWTTFDGVPVRYYRRWPRIGYAPSREMWSDLENEIDKSDLVHITSAFSFPTLASGMVARRLRKPYIVSPRGSLRTEALSRRRWKKAPYWALFERRNLSRASIIHATSDVERKEAVLVLPRTPVVVVPNGIDIAGTPPVERMDGRLIFLGRIHPIKGFDILVPALSIVASRRPGTETVIAGPDDSNEWQRVRALIERQSPKPKVIYRGEVRGIEKLALLASAQALVLTSHTENFGQVVLEALASGTPAVVGRNCPWECLERTGAGRWVDNTPPAIADALLEVLTDRDGMEQRRAAARQLAATFAWPDVGARFVGIYREALLRATGSPS